MKGRVTRVARWMREAAAAPGPAWNGVATGLAGACVLSALAVVAVQHEHRSTFVELQEASREGDRLQEQWGMLQLEQGAWAGHSRVERLARDELQMVMPERDDIVILRR